MLLACLAAAGLAPAVEVEEAQTADPVFLDKLEGDRAATLAEADRAAARAEWAKAARLYQVLVEDAAAAGEELVEAPARDRGELYVGLRTALRARLAALPPAGLRAYRAQVDPRASAELEEAVSSRDEEKLEAALATCLFATPGEEAAVLLGDLYVERGELVGAVATYDLVARNLGPDAARRVARRLANARWALDARAADRANAARVALDSPALAARLSRPLRLDGTRDSGAAPFTEPARLPGGVAVVRPGRVTVVRDFSGARPAVRSLPPGAAAFDALSSGSAHLGASAAEGLLAATIEQPRLLDGDLGPIPGAPDASQELAIDPRPGGVDAPSLDLFVFDVARGDRLLWTTAEVGQLPREAIWLASVEWTGVPRIGSGAVFAAATTRGGEPEIHAAAFDARTGRLRWRRFLCARSYVAAETREWPQAVAPALTLAEPVVLVDTGLGALFALDAFRGEIRWVRRWKSRPGPVAERVDPSQAPPAAPLAGPLPELRDLAIFSGGEGGATVALSIETGERLWRTACEAAPPRAVAFVGTSLFTTGAETALFDACTGKRLGDPLRLPEPVEGRAAVFDAPSGSTLPARAVLPMRSALLVVALRGGRVLPEQTIPLEPARERGDAIEVPGGAAYVSAEGLMGAPGGPVLAPEERLLALMEVYAYSVEPADVAAAIRELRGLAAAARAGARPAPRAAGLPFALEWAKEDEPDLARAWMDDGTGARRVAIAIDAAGELSLEIAQRED